MFGAFEGGIVLIGDRNRPPGGGGWVEAGPAVLGGRRGDGGPWCQVEAVTNAATDGGRSDEAVRRRLSSEVFGAGAQRSRRVTKGVDEWWVAARRHWSRRSWEEEEEVMGGGGGSLFPFDQADPITPFTLEYALSP